MAIISQEQAAEENRKRLLEESRKNSAASLISNNKDAVQLNSLPQVSTEERTRVMNEQAAKISGLRDSLPNPIQMNQAGAITPVSAPIDPFVSTTKAERYLQDLSLPTTPIGNGGYASQSTANNINASIQSQQNSQRQDENTRTTALAKIAETAPARQAAAKAANMTDEAGQQASMDRHNKFAGTNDTLPKSNLPADAPMKDRMAEFNAGSPDRARAFQDGVRNREMNAKNVQLEYKLATQQRNLASRNMQNINKILQQGGRVDPTELERAHAYLAMSERRLGGSTNYDEMMKYSQDNVDLREKNLEGYNKQFGYASPVAPSPAPQQVSAPMVITKKDDNYSRRSPRESLLESRYI